MEKNYTIKVLDNGYVKYIDSMGSDESIIEAARMSTGKGFQNWDKDIGLLDYLYRHEHMSPFEMPELIIEVQAPIFVFREWHRHRTQSFNEFSARYSKMSGLHYVPEKSRIAKQSKSNAQASSDELFNEEYSQLVIDELKHEQELIYSEYSKMIDSGIAKEVARINTPVSRYSKMRAKSNLRNWLHFLDLRMRNNAQLEIRQYANAVSEIIKDLFPRVYAEFEEHTLHAIKFSKKEMQAIKSLILNPNEIEDAIKKQNVIDKLQIQEFINKLI
ncbi:MAG: FAD-dependent thymidylate synthase [Bacteroidia bacterium]